MEQAPRTLSSKGLTLVGYHDLEGRPGFKMGIQVVDGRWYLYMGHLWHRGWSILDITDPTRPQLVRFIEGPPNTWTIQVNVADGLMLTSLERICDGYDDRMHLWGGDPNQPYEEGVIIWDVRNPVEPRRVGEFRTGGHGTHRNFYAGGRYACLAANMKGYRGNIFVLLDISDPSHPREVSRWWVKGQWVEGGESSERFYSLHGPPYMVGHWVYLPYGRAGFIILDVSDPQRPRMASRIDIGDFGSFVGAHSYLPIPHRGLAIATTEAILEDERDPMNLALVVDVSDPTRAKPIANFPTPIPPPELGVRDFHERGGKFGPHNIHMPHHQACLAEVDDVVHICYENAGLWLYDISVPGVPVPIAYYIPEAPRQRRGLLPRVLETQIEDVIVDARGYIYCTDKNHGLFVLRRTS